MLIQFNNNKPNKNPKTTPSPPKKEEKSSSSYATLVTCVQCSSIYIYYLVLAWMTSHSDKKNIFFYMKCSSICFPCSNGLPRSWLQTIMSIFSSILTEIYKYNSIHKCWNSLWKIHRHCTPYWLWTLGRITSRLVLFLCSFPKLSLLASDSDRAFSKMKFCFEPAWHFLLIVNILLKGQYLHTSYSQDFLAILCDGTFL